ncbi:hypothetical protein RFI_15778 [Reticulomyxa filosa]|uniref:Uncharacterized protein n=1 Tax=Reticulomyxa filosa TaxID=46433 RepID=X6N805_RETFI|nr:hypothetical protein RFI_15778 [Reticulomyxa filosa]|eukprot:ETO21427.1 hypothetical protein RFI_15778 [Reticulomyxa filosa]
MTANGNANASSNANAKSAVMSYRQRYEEALQRPPNNPGRNSTKGNVKGNSSNDVVATRPRSKSKNKNNYIKAIQQMNGDDNNATNSNGVVADNRDNVKDNNMNGGKYGGLDNTALAYGIDISKGTGKRKSDAGSSGKRGHRRSLSAVLYDHKNDNYKSSKPSVNDSMYKKSQKAAPRSARQSHNTHPRDGKHSQRHQRSVTLTADVGGLTFLSAENLLHHNDDITHRNSGTRHNRSLTLSSSPFSSQSNPNRQSKKQSLLVTTNRVHDMVKLFGTNLNTQTDNDQNKQSNKNKNKTKTKIKTFPTLCNCRPVKQVWKAKDIEKDIIGLSEAYLWSPEPNENYHDEGSPEWTERRFEDITDGEIELTPRMNRNIDEMGNVKNNMGALSLKRRKSNQFEAWLKNEPNNRNDSFHVIEMDMSENASATKIKFDPASHTAIFDPSTNIIIWSNGRKWVRKDFAPFYGHWRDPQAHVITIEENGTVTYIEPKDLGTYSAIICGFFKIGIHFGNYTYTAKLVNPALLEWDNGIQWTKIKTELA